jgi:predicted DNA-binding protein (MmcQ/YjbR family)
MDQVMPHPIYGAQHWVCVLNSGEATSELVRELLVDAHAFAARKDANQHARRSAPRS